MAFFKSGIKPSGVTVSGLIAVVFILKSPAIRERERVGKKKKKSLCIKLKCIRHTVVG